MHYMLVNQLHSHYIQHVMYVITYPLHAFEDANDITNTWFCILFCIFYIFYIFCIFMKFHINFNSLLPKRSQVPFEHQKQKDLSYSDSMTRIHQPWCTSWHAIVKTRTQDLRLQSLPLHQLGQLPYYNIWKNYILYHNIHIMHIMHISNIFCIL